jgi:hypothetical protein
MIFLDNKYEEAINAESNLEFHKKQFNTERTNAHRNV